MMTTTGCGEPGAGGLGGSGARERRLRLGVGQIPRRRDDDSTDLNGGKVGLGSARPIVVFDFDRADFQSLKIGRVLKGERRAVAAHPWWRNAPSTPVER